MSKAGQPRNGGFGALRAAREAAHLNEGRWSAWLWRRRWVRVADGLTLREAGEVLRRAAAAAGVKDEDTALTRGAGPPAAPPAKRRVKPAT
jgi:hypothetical protein